MLSSLVVTFESANINVSGTSSFAASTTWFLGIEGPSGTLKTLDLGTPDDTAQNPDIDIVIASLVDGDYTFTLTVHPSNDPGQAQTFTQEFCLERDTTLDINVTDDCEELTVSDDTIYPITETLTRLHTIQYPTVPGVSPTADLTSANAEVTIDMALSDGLRYEFVTWTVVTDVSGTFSHTTGIWKFIYPITFTQSVVNHEVRCNTDLCGAIACVDSAWLSLIDEACNRGGINKLPPGEQEKLQTLLGHLALYRFWSDCGNSTKATEYYDKIVALTSVDCSPDTSPKAIDSTVQLGFGWTEIPSSAYAANHSQVLGSELSWRLDGRTMYFRGAIDIDAFSTSGLEAIEADYWTGLGITFADGIAPLLDINTSTPNGCIGFVKVVSNALWIFATASADPSHNHSIAGQLLIE